MLRTDPLYTIVRIADEFRTDSGNSSQDGIVAVCCRWTREVASTTIWAQRCVGEDGIHRRVKDHVGGKTPKSCTCRRHTDVVDVILLLFFPPAFPLVDCSSRLWMPLNLSHLSLFYLKNRGLDCGVCPRLAVRYFGPFGPVEQLFPASSLRSSMCRRTAVGPPRLTSILSTHIHLTSRHEHALSPRSVHLISIPPPF